MARKNFKDIDIYAGIQQKNGQQWQQENGISANWRTPSRYSSLSPWSVLYDVPLPSVDHPSVCRILNG